MKLTYRLFRKRSGIYFCEGYGFRSSCRASKAFRGRVWQEIDLIDTLRSTMLTCQPLEHPFQQREQRAQRLGCR